MNSLIGSQNPRDLLSRVLFNDGRDRHNKDVARPCIWSGGNGDVRRHAGQRFDSRRSLHGKADFEDLRLRVGYLCDLLNMDRKLPAWRYAELRYALPNRSRTKVGGNVPFRNVDHDFDIDHVLEPDHRIVCDDVLPHIDKPLSHDAIVRSTKRAVAKLKLRLSDAAFKSAN